MTGDDFQEVILRLSQHMADEESGTYIELDYEEVVALMEGFRVMSHNIGQAVEIIEGLEGKLEEKERGKLWRP